MSPRRIDLVTPPYSGHLHPMLGLGRAAAQAGYDVRVISTSDAVPRITSAGLDAVVLLPEDPGSVQAIVDLPAAVANNPIKLRNQFRRTLAALTRVREDLDHRWNLDPPDLVVADFTVPVAGPAAGKLGIPWWTTHPSPCVIETPDGPPAYLGGLRHGSGAWFWVRDALGRSVVRGFKRFVFATHRAEIARAGQTRLYREDGSEEVYSGQRILALGMRELEFSRTWPRSVEFLGPILYTPAWEGPDPEYDPAHPHVLVTLGTHLAWAKEAMLARTREAAERLPKVRFHFTDGKPMEPNGFSEGEHGVNGPHGANPSDSANPPNLRRYPYIHYERHLGRYDLVVHHGGTGIMYHCLRHGIPALTSPLDYDQFDYAVRLEHHGVVWRLHPSDDLAERVGQALIDPGLKRRCRWFQEQLTGSGATDRWLELLREQLGPA